MRKMILYLSGLLIGFTAKSQFSVAIVGGPQTTSVNPTFTLRPDTTSRITSNASKTGIRIGFIANVPVNNKQTLFFQTGILYSQKGSKVQQQYDTSNVNLTVKKALFQGTSDLNVYYIDAPFNLVYKLPLKGKTKFIFGGGLQASLFYNGKTSFTGMSVYQDGPNAELSYEYKITDNNDLPVGKGEAQFRTLHFSADALGGFEFGRVFLTVNYSKALSGFYKANGQSHKFSTLGASLGIFLGNPKPKKEVPKDQDGDGITDEKDECPSLPGSALTNGCPDKDGDGIADKDDHCPDVAGSLQNGGCPVIEKPVLDKDGDGVNDSEDQCPETAGSKKYNGCPIPDTDKDGINDEEDQCPGVAGIQKYNGCPVPDSDSDGVNDEEDQCPTQAGSQENHGCPQITKEEKEKISYAAKQIQFKFGRAELSTFSYASLDEVVEILKNNPTLNLRIEGHTSGPNNESNMKLSQKRADTVKAYFISKEIAESRLRATGYGSTKPASSSLDKKENRRVELTLF